MATGKYIIYKIEDMRYRCLCKGLHTIVKLVKMLASQKIKNIVVRETKRSYIVKF